MCINGLSWCYFLKVIIPPVLKLVICFNSGESTSARLWVFRLLEIIITSGAETSDFFLSSGFPLSLINYVLLVLLKYDFLAFMVGKSWFTSASKNLGGLIAMFHWPVLSQDFRNMCVICIRTCY